MGLFDGINDFINGFFNPESKAWENGLFGTKNGGITQTLTDPAGWWDQFKNGKTNTTNAAIAEENLEHQRERNAVEDARYTEETKYNRDFASEEQAYQRSFTEGERDYQRAFAENERDYQRQLQQQLFEREDTALERQASSLSAMGINPLSYQMQGLGAGQAVSASSAPSPISPSSGSPGAMSSRGGSALHNDFKMQDVGFHTILSSLMDTANAFENLNTQGVQRDSIRSQININNAELLSKQLDAERHEMENLVFANKNGIKIDDNGNMSIPDFKHKEQDFNDLEYRNNSATAGRNENEYEHQLEFGTTDSSSWIERTATGATKQLQRASNYITNKASDVATTIANNANNDYERLKRLGSWFKNQASKAYNWYKRHSVSNDDLQRALNR